MFLGPTIAHTRGESNGLDDDFNAQNLGENWNRRSERKEQQMCVLVLIFWSPAWADVQFFFREVHFGQ